MSDEKQPTNQQSAAEAKPQTEAAPAAEKPQGVPPLPPFKGLLGQKLGMARIFVDSGRAVSATVIEAGPCPVVQVKSPARDGYSAVTLGYGKPSKKAHNKARAGVFNKGGVPEQRWLREFRLPSTEGFQIGQQVNIGCFSKGDYVDISGRNKGKGFQGVVKRHRFGGGPRTHGQSDRLRAPGSSGGQCPQRVFRGSRRPGHMGFEMSTVQRLQVLHVDPEKHVLAVKGAVPGPNGNFVIITPTVKKIKIHHAPTPAKAKAAVKGKAPAAAARPGK